MIYDLTDYKIVAFHEDDRTILISYHKGSGYTSVKRIDKKIELSGSLRDMDCVTEFAHNLRRG